MELLISLGMARQ